jgi:hypothetical protein
MEIESLIKLEKELLNPNVRKDFDRLNDLLHEDFFEIGTSGKAYDKAIILDRLPKEDPQPIESLNFITFSLGNDFVQVRFDTSKTRSDGSISRSKRSSIWKKCNGEWKIVFHQGTRVPENDNV